MKKLWENKYVRWTVYAILIITFIWLMYYFFVSRPKTLKKKQDLLDQYSEQLTVNSEQTTDITDPLPPETILTTASAMSGNEGIIVPMEFPLKKGSTGSRVRTVQHMLKETFNQPVKLTGIWDNETEEAMQKAKKRHNISFEVWDKWGWEKVHQKLNA